jgi:hypothetical protein
MSDATVMLAAIEAGAFTGRQIVKQRTFYEYRDKNRVDEQR